MITLNNQSTNGQRGFKASIAGKLTIAALLLATQPAFAEDKAVPKQLPSVGSVKIDNLTINKAPPSDIKRFYVIDPGHFYMSSRTFVMDANNNKLKLHGQIDGGKLPHVAAASTGKFVGIANTTYDRIAHGKRDDYIRLHDAQTLEAIADIDIPEIRFLAGVIERLAALSTDDKHMLIQQFSPSSGVGLVDLESKKFVKTMEVPDCYHIFPAPKQNFFMHCRDGSMLQVTYDDQGNSKQKNSKVFHSEKEYLHNNPYYSNSTGQLVWPTYEGKVYQAKLSESGAEFLKPIEIFSDKEKKEKWAPGGWQPVAFNKERNEIYLLADKRAKWTHKNPSRFVVVADAATGKRLRTISLKRDIDSIAVTQDKNPTLIAASIGEKSIFTFDAVSGKALASMDEMGHAPQIIVTMDK
jgi:methylamine dehydrogenase heavy chain